MEIIGSEGSLPYVKKGAVRWMVYADDDNTPSPPTEIEQFLIDEIIKLDLLLSRPMSRSAMKDACADCGNKADEKISELSRSLAKIRSDFAELTMEADRLRILVSQQGSSNDT